MSTAVKEYKIIFIDPPQNWRDRETIKPRNYGIERILSYLLEKKVLTEQEYACYDFSFDTLEEDRLDQDRLNHDRLDHDKEAYVQTKVETLPYAEFYCFSVMETNFEAAIAFAKQIKQQSQGKNQKPVIIFGGTAAAELREEIIEAHSCVDVVIPLGGQEPLKQLLSKTPTPLENIPNLIIRNKKGVHVTKKVYPEPEWDHSYVKEITWTTTGTFLDDHILVLGSVGCIAKCEFCSIIKKEPQFYERSTELICQETKSAIEIAKKRGKEKVYLQLLHQNFCYRLKEIILALEREGLLENIGAVGFNSRADTFLVEKNQEDIQYVLTKYPNLKVEIFIGIENYTQRTLDNIGKKITAQTNVNATKRLIDLKERHPNFNFLLSWIGLTFQTTKQDLEQNLRILLDMFTTGNTYYPAHYFFSSPLRLGKDLAEKYNLPRRKGHYLKNNFEKFRQQGQFTYPKDRQVIDILEKYTQAKESIPDFQKRKEFILKQYDHERNPLTHIQRRVFMWAELFMLERILNNLPYDDIVELVNAHT